jgi:hypothetical protein
LEKTWFPAGAEWDQELIEDQRVLGLRKHNLLQKNIKDKTG